MAVHTKVPLWRGIALDFSTHQRNDACHRWINVESRIHLNLKDFFPWNLTGVKRFAWMKSDSSIWIFKVYWCNLTRCTWKSIVNWMIRWTSIYRTTYVFPKEWIPSRKITNLWYCRNVNFKFAGLVKFCIYTNSVNSNFYNMTVLAIFSILSWTIWQSCIEKTFF